MTSNVVSQSLLHNVQRLQAVAWWPVQFAVRLRSWLTEETKALVALNG